MSTWRISATSPVSSSSRRSVPRAGDVPLRDLRLRDAAAGAMPAVRQVAELAAELAGEMTETGRGATCSTRWRSCWTRKKTRIWSRRSAGCEGAGGTVPAVRTDGVRARLRRSGMVPGHLKSRTSWGFGAQAGCSLVCRDHSVTAALHLHVPEIAHERVLSQLHRQLAGWHSVPLLDHNLSTGFVAGQPKKRRNDTGDLDRFFLLLVPPAHGHDLA